MDCIGIWKALSYTLRT